MPAARADLLSVVIPALNAAGSLPACLETLRGADEIILVDGGSKDDTVGLAERAGLRVIVSPRGRGVQLRAGAEAARGDWLLFLHADTGLSADWCKAAASHMRLNPGKAGCFRFKLDDAAWQARAIERGVALRTRLLALPYGDQGLLIPTNVYEAVGGYAPLPLMEDVDLVRRIGRRRLRLLDADAVTSAERWRRDGWFRRSARNLVCFGLYGIGVEPSRIASFYAR